MHNEKDFQLHDPDALFDCSPERLRHMQIEGLAHALQSIDRQAKALRLQMPQSRHPTALLGLIDTAAKVLAKAAQEAERKR